jgi:hypothetical protein
MVRRSTRIVPPPCECVECSQQYRTKDRQNEGQYLYAELRNEADAEALLKREVAKIRGDQQYLRDTISKHGNTIVGRWKKKSVSKRADCLAKAFPGIEPSKRPIFQYVFDQAADRLESDYRNAYLLPYLSQEDLKVDPMRFLSLLHCRTKYDIDAWVLFDLKQTRAGYDHGRLALEHSPSCVVMYGSDYGKLVPWNKTEAHRWDIIGYPRAQIILEAQRVLMDFLRKTLEDLLEGVEIESSSSKWAELRDFGFRKSKEDETWSALCNQAYTGPPTFSIDSLLKISRTRMANAEDHLWLLQTDPSYMHSEITYFKSSKLGSILHDDGSKKVYHYAAVVLTNEPIDRAQDWHYIVEECLNLQHVHRSFRDNVKAGESLPPKYNDAISCLELLVVNVLFRRAKMLSKLIPRLRGFESCFSHVHRDAKTGNVLSAPLHGDRQGWYEKDPLFWCLMQMTANPHDPMMFDPEVVFGFFDDLVSQPSKYSVDVTRIEQRLMDEVSDFGAVWELLLAIRYHRPVNRAFDKSEGIRIGSSRAFWRRWDGEDRDAIQKDRASKSLGTLLQKFDDTRIPSGRKDSVWLDCAKEARQSLKAFWDTARILQKSDFERMQSTPEDIESRLSLCSFDLAPEYLAALQQEQDTILERPQTIAKAKSVHDDTQTYLDPSTNDTIIPTLAIRKKEKAKTRADPVSTTISSADTESSTNTELIPTVHVPPDSLQIFRIMYPDTKDGSSGVIDWRRFVRAMADAGLPGTQSSGSAVVFSNGTSRIIFHKPHPVGKIGPVLLATFGKRLSKHFGWRRETFVTADAYEEGNE